MSVMCGGVGRAKTKLPPLCKSHSLLLAKFLRCPACQPAGRPRTKRAAVGPAGGRLQRKLLNDCQDFFILRASGREGARERASQTDRQTGVTPGRREFLTGLRGESASPSLYVVDIMQELIIEFQQLANLSVLDSLPFCWPRTSRACYTCMQRFQLQQPFVLSSSLLLQTASHLRRGS